MNSREYIQHVFSEIISAENFGLSDYEDAFIRAALEVAREVESPLKEEALVRLVMMQQQSRIAYRRERLVS
jgi:hypothetical protein